MQVLAALCFLVLAHLPPLRGEVVGSFQDVPQCLDFFYNRTVPEWGATNPNATRLCQRFNNSYHFATLYDKSNRIAVYSAYRFEASDGGGRKSPWKVEPQLVDPNWSADMQEEYHLKQENPGVDLGKWQALNEDYNNPRFNRGHLNPSEHHPAPSRNATFTLTNAVPQNQKLNNGAWCKYERSLKKILLKCRKAYVLVGAIPSNNTWIAKNNKPWVNIPDYIWNAYCCLDNNDQPISSGGATALNTEENRVDRHTLSQLEMFLSQYQSPVGELFFNNCRAKRITYVRKQ